jgi:ribosomal protein S18 acetylase RimI-like enzyme
MNHDLVIRAAEPTIEEGLVFARYIMEITEGLFRYMIGRRAEEVIAATYAQSKNDMSYENTIFAERGGVILGMASGYTAEEHHHFSDEPLKRAAGRGALRVAGFGLLFGAVFRAMNIHDAGDFYLHYIGVDKDHRGQGIGTALMNAMEERARISGSAQFSLDVAAKNRGAIGVYERYGLSIVSGWPRLPLVKKALYRMTKPV